MPRYYMLNKPKGIISACRDERRRTVLDLFPEEEREGLFHVGRLDRDTEGLLIVTDDGALCFGLLNPEHNVPKTYICWVNGIPSPEKIAEAASGVSIMKTNLFTTRPATVNILERSTLGEIKEYLDGKDVAFAVRRPHFPVSLVRVTLTEGKKHEVKRLMSYMGTRVLHLKRISFAGLSLDPTLRTGEYRPLTEAEITSLVKEAHP